MSEKIYTKRQRAVTGNTPDAKREQGISPPEVLRASRAGAPQPMSPALREKFEPGFGADFSNIRISRGYIPEELGIEAVAKGTDILLDQRAGMDVLGHELAHVVQQATGRVSGGYPVVHDSGLERQADVQGSRVASGMSADMGGMSGFGGETMSIAPMSSATAPAQCKSKEEKEAEERQKKQRKEQREEREMLTTSFANTSDNKKVNAAINKRTEIVEQKSRQDLAGLTEQQKTQAQYLMGREKADANERGASYEAALKRYTDSGKQYNPKSSHHERYLRRHLHGLDEEAQDRMFQAFAENDVDAMAGYITNDFQQYMGEKANGDNGMSIHAGTDELLGSYDKARSMAQNTMTPSDMVKDGTVPLEKLGISPEDFKKIKEELQVDATRGALNRTRISAMAKGDVQVQTPPPQPVVQQQTPPPPPSTTISPKPGQQYVQPQDLHQSGPGWEHTGSTRIGKRMGVYSDPVYDTPTQDLMPGLRGNQPPAPAKKKKKWWPFG